MSPSLRRRRYRLHLIRQNPRLQLQALAWYGLWLSLFATLLTSMQLVRMPGAALVAVGCGLAWSWLYLSQRDPEIWRRALRQLFWYVPADWRGGEADGLRTLRRFYSPTEPLLLGEVLRAHGIQATVLDEHIGSMRFELARAVGGVRVMVPAADLEAAEELLAGFTQAARACPNCGARDPVFFPYRPALANFSGWLELLMPISYRRFQCLACRHTWQEDTPEVDSGPAASEIVDR